MRAGKYIGGNYLLLHRQELILITQTLPTVAKGKTNVHRYGSPWCDVKMEFFPAIILETGGPSTSQKPIYSLVDPWGFFQHHRNKGKMLFFKHH